MLDSKKINKYGFTLNEVILVSFLLGIIATFAIPRYASSVERARLGEGLQILEALHKGQSIFNFENNNYTNSLANLDVTFPTAPRNFDTLSVSIPVGPANTVASVRRIGNLYTLSISINGTISCVDGVDAGICQRIGCTGAGGTCN